MSKTLSKIIAIGGGSVYVPCQPANTLAIDQEAVRLAIADLPQERTKPNFLFIPTASSDSIGYCHDIYTNFHLRLGCNYDHLLLTRYLSDQDIRAKIEWADIIYVGGGNTREMMKEWEIWGVDGLLKEASKQGKVLMGLSAGSICWFESGLSDSNKFDALPGEDWRPMWVKGLNLLPFANCPHYDTEKWRSRELKYMLNSRELKKTVIALDNNCAFQVVGESYRVISSQPGQNAFLFRGGELKKIVQRKEFVPLGEL